MPVVVAAWLLRIPVISHESDVAPGLATRINGRFSKRICLAHEYGVRYFRGGQRRKVMVSGNPIRRQILRGDSRRGWEFVAACQDAKRHAGADGKRQIGAGAEGQTDGQRQPGADGQTGAEGQAGAGARMQQHSGAGAQPSDRERPVVLCMGGSLGAQQINRLVADVGARLIADYRCIIIHQTGQHTITNAELEQSPYYISIPYIGVEIGDVLALAAVVVGRAGANSLWECAAMKKAMVLVPLPKQSSRGDQIINARLFSEHNAAIVLGDDAAVEADGTTAQDDDARMLLHAVGRLLSDKKSAAEMGTRAHRLITHDATDILARLISQTLDGRS